MHPMRLAHLPQRLPYRLQMRYLSHPARVELSSRHSHSLEVQTAVRHAKRGPRRCSASREIDQVLHHLRRDSAMTEKQEAAHAGLAAVVQQYINDQEFRYFYDLVGEQSAQGMAPEEMVGWVNNPVNPAMMRHWMQQCAPASQTHTQEDAEKQEWLAGLNSDPYKQAEALMRWQWKYADTCRMVVEYLDVQAEASANQGLEPSA